VRVCVTRSAAPRRLQRHGRPSSCTRGSRPRSFLRRRGRSRPRASRSALPRDGAPRPGRGPRPGKGLGNGVPRPHPRRTRGPVMDAAMEHIRKHGIPAHRGDSSTRDHGRAMRFLREVDSSLVLVNRLDPLQRRLPARSGGGDRHQHDKDPRLRTHGLSSSPRQNSRFKETGAAVVAAEPPDRHLRAPSPVPQRPPSDGPGGSGGLSLADPPFPSARPPHSLPGRCPAEDRLAMESAAVAGIEGSPSWTSASSRKAHRIPWLTVRKCRKGNPGADLLFLVAPTRARRSGMAPVPRSPRCVRFPAAPRR